MTINDDADIATAAMNGVTSPSRRKRHRERIIERGKREILEHAAAAPRGPRRWPPRSAPSASPCNTISAAAWLASAADAGEIETCATPAPPHRSIRRRPSAYAALARRASKRSTFCLRIARRRATLSIPHCARDCRGRRVAIAGQHLDSQPALVRGRDAFASRRPAADPQSRSARRGSPSSRYQR